MMPTAQIMIEPEGVIAFIERFGISVTFGVIAMFLLWRLVGAQIKNMQDSATQKIADHEIEIERIQIEKRRIELDEARTKTVLIEAENARKQAEILERVLAVGTETKVKIERGEEEITATRQQILSAVGDTAADIKQTVATALQESIQPVLERIERAEVGITGLSVLIETGIGDRSIKMQTLDAIRVEINQSHQLMRESIDRLADRIVNLSTTKGHSNENQVFEPSPAHVNGGDPSHGTGGNAGSGSAGSGGDPNVSGGDPNVSGRE